MSDLGLFLLLHPISTRLNIILPKGFDFTFETLSPDLSNKDCLDYMDYGNRKIVTRDTELLNSKMVLKVKHVFPSMLLL